MRLPTLAAAVLSLIACSPEDLAAFQPPGGAAVNELSHRVAVKFDTGVARLTVTRQLRNDTLDYQALQHHLLLPEGAIATSLRVGAEGSWPEQARLASAEDALVRWEDLTAPGQAPPSTLGLLKWSWSGGLDLDLFGLAPGATVNVEYDVELSPSYEAGERMFDYPQEEPSEGWRAVPDFQMASATLTRVQGGSAEAEGTTAGFRLGQSWAPRDLLDARWARYPLGSDRTLWRREVDVAAQLEPAPVRPNVVFVVDASHSEAKEGIDAQLELIPPYLASSPEAQVEIILYRRFAERLFGRFVPAGDVARLLASTPAERLAPGNGSNLELGAALAAQALSQTVGTGRIILFTDEQLRHGFSNEAAIGALATASDTVVHVVARTAGAGNELFETRDDEAPLSGVAAASGGVFLRVTGKPQDRAQAAHALLGLVRPIRIDTFSVEAPGVEEEQLQVGTELFEGAALRQSGIGEQPPPEVTLTGKIWARDFRRVVTIDRALAGRLPGLAIADGELWDELSEHEQRTVAFASRAVSPVSAYLSAPAGAEASTAGVQRDLAQSLSFLSGISRSVCGLGVSVRRIPSDPRSRAGRTQHRWNERRERGGQPEFMTGSTAA